MLKSLLTVLAVLTSMNAIANDGSSVSTSASSGSGSLVDKLHVGYFGIIHGPNVTSIGSPLTQDATTGNRQKKDSPTNDVNLDGELTVSYLLTKSVGVGPVLPFFYTPVLGQGFTMGDAGARIYDRKFIKTNEMTIYANLILQLPTSDYSSMRGMDLGVKMTPNIRYIIPSTRFTLGAWTEQKAYLGVNSGKTFKLYGQPYANYQVTPKFSWNVGFEMEADHFANSKAAQSLLDLTMTQTDLMPGFVYMITPSVIVNPYFQIYTSQKVSMEHTAIGATLSASI